MDYKKEKLCYNKNIRIVWFHVKMNWIMLFIVKVFNIIGRIRKDTGVYAGVFFVYVPWLYLKIEGSAYEKT